MIIKRYLWWCVCALASVGAGAWRIILMPVDTVKTCLQVDGPEGWKTLQKRVQKEGFSVLFNGRYECMYIWTSVSKFQFSAPNIRIMFTQISVVRCDCGICGHVRGPLSVVCSLQLLVHFAAVRRAVHWHGASWYSRCICINLLYVCMYFISI